MRPVNTHNEPFHQPRGERNDATRETPSTHATGTASAHDTSGIKTGTAEAKSATGSPTVITKPATGIANGFAKSEITGTNPNTISETGAVPN